MLWLAKTVFMLQLYSPQERDREERGGGGGGPLRCRYPKDVRHHSESLLKEENFRYLKATTKLRASSLPSF